MPIRLCQKCGLKVLVDESQVASATFYCQRCTIALKNQEAQALGAAAASPPAPAPSAPAPKPATVRVLCPYCKASFNGRVPQRPARGACPVCQKDLILLPTGEIRPAAGFDLAKWQQEQKKPATRAPVAEAEGTQMLVRKFSAPAPRTAPAEPEAEPAPAAPPEPEPVRVPHDEGGGAAELPSWLDEPSGSARAPRSEAAPAPAVDDAPPSPSADLAAEASPKADENPPARVEEPEPPAPPPAPEPEPEIRIAPELEVPRAPEPPPPVKAVTSRRTTGRRTAAPAPAPERNAAPAPARGGAGKAAAAYLLLALPPALLAAFLWPGASLAEGEWSEKLGARFRKGFAVLRERLAPPPPAAPPPAEEKTPSPPPPEEKPKPTPEDQERAKAEIIKLWDEVRFAHQKIRQLSVGATAEQKEAIEAARRDLQVKEERLNARVALYKEIYGEEFDPRKQ
jgi:hypothetical protein